MGKSAEGAQRVGRALRSLGRSLWRGPRWLRWGGLIAVVVLGLLLVAPVFSLATTGGELVLMVVEPLRSTAIGRVVFVALILGVATALLAWVLRPRWQGLRGRAALGRYLRAEEELLRGRTKRGARLLRQVARYRGPLPDGFDELPHRAELQLVRHALAERRPERALEILGRMDLEGATESVRRAWQQLHGRALLQQGEVLPRAVADELEEALAGVSRPNALLADLAEARRRAGDLPGAAEALEQRLLTVAVGQRGAALTAAVEAWRDVLQQALEAGRADDAQRSLDRLRALDAGGPTHLYEGDLLALRDDPMGAVAAWGRDGSAAAALRVGSLLRGHPGTLSVDQLLRRCPTQGALIVAAAEFRRRGESDKAERAARQAWRALRGSPLAAAVVADVLEALGHRDDAEAVLLEGLTELLRPDPGADRDAARGSPDQLVDAS